MRIFLFCYLISRDKKGLEYDYFFASKSIEFNGLSVLLWEKVIHFSISQTDNVALTGFP